MDCSADRGRNGLRTSAKLKKSCRPIPSSSPISESTATDERITSLGRLAPSMESKSARPRNTHVSALKDLLQDVSNDTDSTNSADPDDANLEAEHQVLKPVAKMSKCDACWKPLGEFEGSVLGNCRQHVVCHSCLYHGIQDAVEVGKIPTCPVETCCARIKKSEIEIICADGQAKSTNGESEASLGDGKKPTSSGFDDSEAIAPSEGIMLSRENGARIVSQKRLSGECDKCRKPVDEIEFLEVRNCKMKHKVCFECIRAAVNISKTLVRCPLYRECKSMMARDEVLQVRYNIKETEKKRWDSPSKSKAKAKKYIYPNGLPTSELWPVLTGSKCSKCGRDIDVLNGIVVKQCNVHGVCVKCVREKIAMDKNLVECPMYISCKSVMMEDEVKAFIRRFGGPPEV